MQKQLNFDLYLTKPQIQHLENIMNAMISKGFNGKVSDITGLLQHDIELVLLDYFQIVLGMKKVSKDI